MKKFTFCLFIFLNYTFGLAQSSSDFPKESLIYSKWITTVKDVENISCYYAWGFMRNRLDTYSYCRNQCKEQVIWEKEGEMIWQLKPRFSNSEKINGVYSLNIGPLSSGDFYILTWKSEVSFSLKLINSLNESHSSLIGSIWLFQRTY